MGVVQMRSKSGDQTINSSTGDDSLEALSKYGQDLTAQVAHLDPIIGRDEEIRRVIRILCRRTKNNPVLIGEPGMFGSLETFHHQHSTCTLSNASTSLLHAWQSLESYY